MASDEKKQTDFIDFLNFAIVVDKKIKKGYSYDGGLDSWKNFKRLEP